MFFFEHALHSSHGDLAFKTAYQNSRRRAVNVSKCLAIGFLLACSVQCYAESRILGVRVVKEANSKVRVSIYSDVKQEDQRNLTVEDAAALLRKVNGGESSVFVGIEAHRVPLADYMPLVKAISENFWLDLTFIEGRKPDFIFDNIKQSMKKEAAVKDQ
jgi:hypothetical protein